MIRKIIGLTMSVTLTCVLVGSLSGCSSKKAKTDGDTAADTSAMAPTEVAPPTAAPAPIPELGAVYFAYDSFALTAQSKTALEKHATWLKTNSGKKVQIQGHTDERGTTEYNLALGERRAGAVKDFLTSKGVSSSQLSTISYGEERPASEGHDESAWSKNRRAEFYSN